jgi:hypothetical protein
MQNEAEWESSRRVGAGYFRRVAPQRGHNVKPVFATLAAD